MRNLRNLSAIATVMLVAATIAIPHFISTAQAKDKKPNVVILMADDVGWNDFGAHRIIFNAILQQQLLDLEAGIPLSNCVAPATLSPAGRDQLKWALERVPGVSNLLGDPLSH